MCQMALKRTSADMAYVGRPNHDLNDGKYVVSLEDTKSGKSLRAEGIQVRQDMDWGTRFSKSLGDRLKTRVFHPVSRKGPLFSIITPVYNTAPGLLKELFEAIRSQRFRNFEWLVLDNGSQRSETTQTLAGLASRDPRIRLFREGSQDNWGKSASSPPSPRTLHYPD